MSFFIAAFPGDITMCVGVVSALQDLESARRQAYVHAYVELSRLNGNTYSNCGWCRPGLHKKEWVC